MQPLFNTDHPKLTTTRKKYSRNALIKTVEVPRSIISVKGPVLIYMDIITFIFGRLSAYRNLYKIFFSSWQVS